MKSITPVGNLETISSCFPSNLIGSHDVCEAGKLLLCLLFVFSDMRKSAEDLGNEKSYSEVILDSRKS